MLLWCSTLEPRCTPPVGKSPRYQVEYNLQPDCHSGLTDARLVPSLGP